MQKILGGKAGRTRPARVRLRTIAMLGAALLLVLAACTPKPQPVPAADTGSLSVTIEGLPAGVAAGVTVSGPGSYSQTVASTTTLEDLAVGTYTVTAAAVSGHVVSGRSSWTVDVEKGKTANVDVLYSAADPATLGSLRIEVEGLSGADAAITVTGPGSFSVPVTTAMVLENLVPGTYTVAAAAVTGFVVSGVPTQTAEVTAGKTAAVTVTYVSADVGLGNLSFTVMGIATGAEARLLVEGPDSYNQEIRGPVPLPDLANLKPGPYTVTAQAIADHLTVGTSETTVEVKAGETANATVTYMHAGLSLSGAADVLLPLQGNQNLTFTINRIGQMDGPVDYTVSVPVGMTATPGSGTVPAGTSAFTVQISDDGTAGVAKHEASVTVSGSEMFRSLSDEIELTIDLAPVVTVGTDDESTPLPGSLRSLVYDPRTTGQEITFAEELYGAAGITIALDDTLDITKSVKISGPVGWGDSTGPLVRLDAGSAHRVIVINSVALNVPGPTVVLSNIQVQNGFEQDGAGIRVDGGSDLTLNNVWVHSNVASRHGGGVWILDNSVVSVEKSRVEANTAALRGAGLYLQSGTLDILNSAVTANTGAQNGGGIMAANGSGFLNITDSTISDNSAVNGAGVLSHAEAVIQGSFILDNKASGDGGGIRNHRQMEITDTVVEDNIAGGDYGGVFSDGIMTIRDSWVRGNSAGGHGGGVFNGWYGSDTIDALAKEMTIERTEISGNSAGESGGGVHSIRRLQVGDSYIHNNIANGGDGGGIYSVSIPHSGVIANDGGTLLISGTTIADNHAPLGNGGGVYSGTFDCRDEAGYSEGTCLNPFTEVPNADLHIYNSTIVLNTAQWGGGIATAGANDGEVRLNFSTIAHNIANGSIDFDGEGGGVHNSRADFRIRGNIFAHNVVSGGGNNTIDVYTWLHSVESDGYNFLQWAPDVDVGLSLGDLAPGALAALSMEQVLSDNGGFAPTLALNTGSAYGSHVPSAACLNPSGAELTIDQRGEPRPGGNGTGCSIGAYEYQGG